jgi:hypothetical protein
LTYLPEEEDEEEFEISENNFFLSPTIERILSTNETIINSSSSNFLNELDIVSENEKRLHAMKNTKKNRKLFNNEKMFTIELAKLQLEREKIEFESKNVEFVLFFLYFDTNCAIHFK